MTQDIRLTKLILETSHCKLTGKFLFKNVTVNKSTSMGLFQMKLGKF
jgi:hypothetical protein